MCAYVRTQLYRLASSELRRAYSQRDSHAVYLEYLQRHVAIAAAHAHGNGPHGMNDACWLRLHAPPPPQQQQQQQQLSSSSSSSSHHGSSSNINNNNNNNSSSSNNINGAAKSFLDPLDPIAIKVKPR